MSHNEMPLPDAIALLRDWIDSTDWDAARDDEGTRANATQVVLTALASVPTSAAPSNYALDQIRAQIKELVRTHTLAREAKTTREYGAFVQAADDLDALLVRSLASQLPRAEGADKANIVALTLDAARERGMIAEATPRRREHEQNRATPRTFGGPLDTPELRRGELSDAPPSSGATAEYVLRDREDFAFLIELCSRFNPRLADLLRTIRIEDHRARPLGAPVTDAEAQTATRFINLGMGNEQVPWRVTKKALEDFLASRGRDQEGAK